MQYCIYRLILVACTVFDQEQEVIRIVSARRVTRQERIEYEEASEIENGSLRVEA
jgi:uncharacterized DUF497 family protein